MKVKLMINVLCLIIFAAMLGFLACDSEEQEEFEVKLKATIEHEPLNEHVGTIPVQITLLVKTNYTVTTEMVQLFYREVTETDTSDWTVTNMTPMQADNFQGTIPAQEKGTVMQYYCQVSTPTGEEMALPKEAPAETYTLVFKGEVPRLFQVFHIFLSYLALILVVLSGFYAYRIVANNVPMTHCAWFSLLGFITYIVGSLILGIVVNWYTFGKWWGFLPVGADQTHLFSLFLLVYWFFTLLGVNAIFLSKTAPKTWFGDKTFAYLTLINTGFYILIVLFAH